MAGVDGACIQVPCHCWLKLSLHITYNCYFAGSCASASYDTIEKQLAGYLPAYYSTPQARHEDEPEDSQGMHHRCQIVFGLSSSPDWTL